MLDVNELEQISAFAQFVDSSPQARAKVVSASTLDEVVAFAHSFGITRSAQNYWLRQQRHFPAATGRGGKMVPDGMITFFRLFWQRLPKRNRLAKKICDVILVPEQ